jgi:uncharacterized protein YgiM (DUF1202 family)
LVATSCIAETYYVTTEIDALNVRDAVYTDIIYGCIRAGRKVNVDYVDGRWAYIQYDGKSCKVYYPYLTKCGDPSEPAYYGGKTGPGTQKTVTRKYVSTDEASMIYEVSYAVNGYITVRAQKSDTAQALGRLYPGDELYVVREGKVWSRIVYDNGYAFVKSSAIYRVGVNLPDEGELKQVSVSDHTTLNVRDGPGKKKRIITTIPDGAFVKEIEADGTWSTVYYSMEDTGFVMSKFLVDPDE